MGQPNFWDNPEKAQQTIQQLKPLNGLLKPFEELESAIGDVGALAELSEEDASLDGELDVELGKAEKLLDDFELRAMLSGPHDASNAYLTIQAGAGGTEACDWAQMLMRLYARWAERSGYQAEIIDELRNEEAGIRSATLFIKGDYAYGYLQSEAGVHRLVRISPFDSNARRQTSFAAVEVLPEIEGTINIEIRPDDLKRDTFRSGGPGGQHQNKTESGVRYTHLPTGIAAESRTERSQHKNDANALNLLKAKLYRIEEEKKRAEVEQRTARRWRCRSAARSATTPCSRTPSSRTSAPASKPGRCRPCSTGRSTSSSRRTCATRPRRSTSGRRRSNSDLRHKPGRVLVRRERAPALRSSIRGGTLTSGSAPGVGNNAPTRHICSQRLRLSAGSSRQAPQIAAGPRTGALPFPAPSVRTGQPSGRCSRAMSVSRPFPLAEGIVLTCAGWSADRTKSGLR